MNNPTAVGSDKLAGAFGIDAQDLAANRSGRLGPAQANRLRRSGRNDVIAAMIAGLVLAAILYGVANKPLKAVQYVMALLLFGAALATGLYHYRRTHAAAAAGTVEMLSGEVQVESRGQSGFFLKVAGRSFRMPIRPWHVTSGARYRVYIAPTVNLVVGMEPEA